MNKKEQNYTQNRELSWLRFNQRVLEEAQDSTVPLLERMKFVAIFTSNLDEFFMIRVGSLFDMVMMENTSVDVRSGMNAREQLDAIYDAVGPMYKERDRTYKDIKKQLAPYGVCGLSFDELEAYEKKYVKQYFKEQVLPVLSPQIVDANHPFPHLLSNELYVIANLTANEKTMIGIVPVPKFISDIIYLPVDDIRYIRMEKVIMEYLELIFEQYEVTEENYVCVTRNADIAPDDDAFDIHEDFYIGKYHCRYFHGVSSSYAYEPLVYTYVNGTLVHEPEERDTGKNSNTLKCSACGKRYKEGSDNAKSIKLTSMCENCYENFKWSQDIKEEINNFPVN